VSQPTPDSPRRAGTGSAKKSPAEHIDELKELLVGYAKQETVDPLKSLRRYLAFGMAGSVLVGVGVSLALLGVLRLLQSLDVFSPDLASQPGALSLVPYAATLVVGVIVIGLAVKVMTSSPPKRRGGKR
jgi:hypothetical protein